MTKLIESNKNKKHVNIYMFGFTSLCISYLIIWSPIAYLFAKNWMEMVISGFGLEDNAFIYWQYLTITLLTILLISPPPMFIYAKINEKK